ncbi:hypothetical protein ACERII_04835 [Evansella sp. AB-rgal1]|uniref:hypothetical protein n=1 Tax=Evansella sp. AB-rgal1 TaxID=3242696 RepID=UPI00359D4D9D
MLSYSLLFIIPLLLYYIGMKNSNKDRTKMEKMMLAMGGSMLVGFTLGLFIGGIFHGSFLTSLILSVILSTVVGIYIGIPHGNIEIVEGLFTGGMAGLMGAMTAEMLSIPELRIVLLLFFLLIGLGAFWSLHFWRKGYLYDKTSKVIFFHFITMCYLLGVTVLFIWHPPFIDANMQHHDHSAVVIRDY